MLKATVMMIGEYDFDSLFFSPQDVLLPYPTFTLLFFLVFMMIMSIIVMNLLVGLAVDDIKGVQENAVLQRLAMQGRRRRKTNNTDKTSIKIPKYYTVHVLDPGWFDFGPFKRVLANTSSL
jgi:hypothetical protein